MIYTVLFAAGTGLVAGGVTLLAGLLLEPARSAGFRIPYTNREDRLALWVGLLGAVLGLLLAWGTQYTGFMAFLGGGTGVGIVVLARRFVVRSRLDARRRDVTALFDAVELYMRAGMPTHHALSAAKILAPSLQPAVNRALSYWPSGAAKALDVLRQEIGLPEGEILVSLLAQINQAGIENLEGIVRRESKRLEQMRNMAERARIGLKPLYLVLFRALPLVAAMGMVAGVLFMRVAAILKDAGLF